MYIFLGPGSYRETNFEELETQTSCPVGYEVITDNGADICS